jgi:raffinose/stachyose/melibiose transport system permease protein
MRRGTVFQIVYLTILSILGLLMLYPFYFMVQTSFKDTSEFTFNFWTPATPFHLDNYSTAFQVIWHYIVNSIIVVGIATAGVVVVATLAAYPFARIRFRGREVLYYSIIAMMMIPAILTLIPQFILIRNANLIDTYGGVILPYVAAGETISIFIMRGFFASLPEELFEAARIDGAGDAQVFLRIALPLVRPAIVAIAILEVLTYWNDYVWPLLILGSDDTMQTLVLGLVNFQTRYMVDYGPQMAGYTLGALPLLLLFAVGMRQFVNGITAGALKL